MIYFKINIIFKTKLLLDEKFLLIYYNFLIHINE